MFCLLGTQGLDLLVGTQCLDLPLLNVVQPLNVLFWRKAYRPVCVCDARPRPAWWTAQTCRAGARNIALYNSS